MKVDEKTFFQFIFHYGEIKFASDCSVVDFWAHPINIFIAQFFLKNGPFSTSFSLYLSFLRTVYSKNVFNNSCRWLDLNSGPLVLEATVLSTVPQLLPNYSAKIKLRYFLIIFIGCSNFFNQSGCSNQQCIKLCWKISL